MNKKKYYIVFCVIFLFMSCTSNKKNNNIKSLIVENTDSVNKSDSINKFHLFDSIMNFHYDEFSNIKYVPNEHFRVIREGYLRIKRSSGVFYIFNLNNRHIDILNKERITKKEEWRSRFNYNIIQLIASDSIFYKLKSKNNFYGLCYIIAKKSYLGRSKIKIFPIYIFTSDDFLNNKVNVENNILKCSKENININVSEIYLDSEIDSETDE